MKQLAAIVALLAAYAGLAYSVWTHPNVDRARELKREYQHLREQNDALARKNDRLRRRIRALRQRKGVAERHARAQGGLARPDELVFQFDDGEPRRTMQVVLEVEPETMSLAGGTVSLDELGGALERLRSRWPEMSVRPEFDEDVDVLRKSRVRELLER